MKITGRTKSSHLGRRPECSGRIVARVWRIEDMLICCEAAEALRLMNYYCLVKRIEIGLEGVGELMFRCNLRVTFSKLLLYS